MLMIAPALVIFLSHGASWTFALAIFFAVGIVRAITLYRSLQDENECASLEYYWHRVGEPSNLSHLFLMGSKPSTYPKPREEIPVGDDVERYRNLILSQRYLMIGACVMLSVGVPIMYYCLATGIGMKPKLDSMFITWGVALQMAIVTLFRTGRESKIFEHYDRWVEMGRPTSFDPWQKVKK